VWTPHGHRSVGVNAKALLLLAVALSMTVVLELQQTMMREAPATGPSGEPRALVSGRHDDDSFDAQVKDPVESLVRTILARPLFEPSRRPPAGAGVTGEVLPRLAGVIIGPDLRRAIFVPAKGSAIVVPEGGRAGGYEIRSIGPNEVVLSGPDGERSIHTDYAKNQPIQPHIIQGRNPADGGQN
jgi:hypothetical protein